MALGFARKAHVCLFDLSGPRRGFKGKAGGPTDFFPFPPALGSYRVAFFCQGKGIRLFAKTPGGRKGRGQDCSRVRKQNVLEIRHYNFQTVFFRAWIFGPKKKCFFLPHIKGRFFWVPGVPLLFRVPKGKFDARKGE